MMQDAILRFHTQFDYEPVVENARSLKTKKKYIVVGMGGSHLSADLLLAYRPEYPLVARRDYGLPRMSGADAKNSLVIVSSYSGNTEEALAAYREARKKGLALASIAVGGKLIALAKKDKTPYVQMPDTGIQPRSALGLSFLALLKLLGEEAMLKETKTLSSMLHSASLRRRGASLAKKMKDKVPVLYCSRANETIAWNWKIKFNETGKIPAFYNVFPELNHNEMTGFDVSDRSRHLSKPFYFLFFTDAADDPRIRKRMAVMEGMYKKRGLPVLVVPLTGKNFLEKAFASLVLADWTAVATADLYGLESEQVPMVEEFKRLIG